MASEVCSIYLLRDNKLELFATHGLRKEAVHVTRLRMGEGLVGTIAAEGRILNLAEAAEHPAFVYRPETGEERFHSFAGVPIVRLESPIGVLAVQHAEPRRYEEVEIEALQTVAMVLSEMIAGARLVDGARRGAAAQCRAAAPVGPQAGRRHGQGRGGVPRAAGGRRAHRRRRHRGRARAGLFGASARCASRSTT